MGLFQSAVKANTLFRRLPLSARLKQVYQVSQNYRARYRALVRLGTPY